VLVTAAAGGVGLACVEIAHLFGARVIAAVGSAAPQFSESSDEPSPFVDIELHQAFVSHLQQQGLASFLIHDIGAFHDFVDFERLLAERAQDIFSIIQHDQTPTVT